MHRRLLAAPLLLGILIASGCSTVQPHEHRAARHVEIAQHAFTLQAIDDCSLPDPKQRNDALLNTGQQMGTYILSLSSFIWSDVFEEDWSQERWQELATDFPLFQSAAVETPSGEAANRLPLLLDDEMVRISLQATHSGAGQDEDSNPQQKYRTAGTVSVEGPYGYADFDVSGSFTLSEFQTTPDGLRTATITGLRWTMVTLDAPISVRLAPGRFDSRVSIDDHGLGEARLVVAFSSTDYPYLDDIYFNAVLNIPVAATPDLKTIMLATPGTVSGTAVAPVMPLPTYNPTEDRNCGDHNANGIPDYIEEFNRILGDVRDNHLGS
ncbi:MAG: hypothetical protein ACIAQF_11710 [Phycisphaerales bacterium JB065]